MVLYSGSLTGVELRIKKYTMWFEELSLVLESAVLALSILEGSNKENDNYVSEQFKVILSFLRMFFLLFIL